MAQALAEVPEAQAEGKIKSIYDDVKATLRVPFVPSVTRSLAVYPDYLIPAWTVLKPNAQIQFFEQQSDRIRRLAVSEATGLGRPPAPPGDESVATVRTLNYALPRIFLATAALRSATNGEQPRMQTLSLDQKRQMKPGVPAGASVGATWDEATEERLQTTVQDIIESHGLVQLTPEFRSLGAQPEYLEMAWAAFKPGIAESQYRRTQWALRQAAEEAVTSFPFRMDINPHALRHAGLSESDLDGVRQILAQFYGQTLAETATVAFLAAGALGANAAENPFPAAVL